MYNERKLKYKNGAIKQFLIIMLFAVMSVVHTDKISAETSSANAAAEIFEFDINCLSLFLILLLLLISAKIQKGPIFHVIRQFFFH